MRRLSEKEIEEKNEEHLNKHCPYRKLGQALESLKKAIVLDFEMHIEKLNSFLKGTRK